MCFWPQLIQNKKYTPNKKNGGVIPAIYDKRVLAVPIGCGECMECRRAKAREWQVRLLEDVRHNKNGKFITLTFSNESIKELAEAVTKKTTKIKEVAKQYVDKNGKLRTRYKYREITEEIILKGYETDNAIATLGVRRFLERWRKDNKKSLRHWLITELGHRGTENVHMHGIIWTDKDLKEIRKKWKYGHIWIGEEDSLGRIKNYVTEKTVNYITKYVHKMDFDHMHYKSKILTSAGIGEGYMRRIDSKNNKYNGEDTKEYYVTRTGHKMGIPIYLRNKIYNDEEREQLWLQKLDKEIRYIGKEKIDVKNGYEEYWNTLEHYRSKSKRLGYGTGTKDWNRKKYEEDRRNLLIQERITKAEEKEMLRRGLRPDPTGGESINNTLRVAGWQWKRDMGMTDEAIIWGNTWDDEI